MDYTNSDQNALRLTDESTQKKQEIEDICADLGIDIDEALSMSQTPMANLSSTSSSLTPSHQGFHDFKKNRDRGESRRYSAMVSGDLGLDDREFLITDAQRSKKIKWYICTSMLNVALISYMTVIIIQTFDSSTDDCVQELKLWIWVYLGVEIAHLVRKITYAIAWKKSKDPTIFTTYFDFFFFVFVVTFQIGWFCYGAYIVFGTTYTGCITNDPDEKVLFYTTASLQIYGFCFMTVYFCIVLCSVVFYIAFRVASTDGEESQEKMAYFKSFDKNSYVKKQNPNVHITICSLCNKKIDSTQYDIKCKNGHKLHQNCVNQSAQIVTCPKCNVEIPKDRNSKLSLISERDVDDSASEIND